MPKRVLPVSTSTPTTLATLFDSEVTEIKKLLGPGRRRRLEALARLRPLAILDGTIHGEKGQPSDADLRKIGNDILSGKPWNKVFSGAAYVEISTDGSGPALSLRISKNESMPIQLVPEGTPGASVVGVKRVNELDFYNHRGTQFLQGATARLSEYLVKGFTMDDERLKNPPRPGQADYVDEMPERIPVFLPRRLDELLPSVACSIAGGNCGSEARTDREGAP